MVQRKKDVDLVKSFQTSIYCFLAKFGFDTALPVPSVFEDSPAYQPASRERASERVQKMYALKNPVGDTPRRAASLERQLMQGT